MKRRTQYRSRRNSCGGMGNEMDPWTTLAVCIYPLTRSKRDKTQLNKQLIAIPPVEIIGNGSSRFSPANR